MHLLDAEWEPRVLLVVCCEWVIARWSRARVEHPPASGWCVVCPHCGACAHPAELWRAYAEGEQA
jgi:hypothetical protein